MHIPGKNLQNDPAVQRDQYRAVVGQTTLANTDIDALRALTGKVIIRIIHVYEGLGTSVLALEATKPLPRQFGEVISVGPPTTKRPAPHYTRGDTLWFEYGRGELFTVEGVEYLALWQTEVVAWSSPMEPVVMPVSPNLFVRVDKARDYVQGKDIILTPADKKKRYEAGEVTHAAPDCPVRPGERIAFLFSAGSAIYVRGEMLRAIDQDQIWGVLE